MQEVGGPVQRVDVPGDLRLLRRRSAPVALLGGDGVVGEAPAQLGDGRLLGGEVDLGDPVGATFLGPGAGVGLRGVGMMDLGRSLGGL